MDKNKIIKENTIKLSEALEVLNDMLIPAYQRNKFLLNQSLILIAAALFIIVNKENLPFDDRVISLLKLTIIYFGISIIFASFAILQHHAETIFQSRYKNSSILDITIVETEFKNRQKNITNIIYLGSGSLIFWKFGISSGVVNSLYFIFTI